MNDHLDPRLREYAARWRATHTDPSPDALVRMVPTLSRGAHERRSVVAVAASVVAVAVVATVPLLLSLRQQDRVPAASLDAPTSPSSTPVVVPWSPAGLRADTTTLRPPAKIGAPNGMRPCSDTDFVLVSGKTDLAPSGDGWLTTTFVLSSVGPTPCAISNKFVDVALLASTGTPLPTDAIPSGGPAVPSMLSVRPGQLVTGRASWAVYEGRAPRPARLVINPSGQTSTRSSSALSVSLAGVTIPPEPRTPSNLGPWRSTAYGSVDTVTDPGTLGSLGATVTAPPSVALGAVLRYRVTLTNPTATAVTLATCPDFVEQLDVIPAKTPTTVGFRGPLNCAPAPKAIGAGEAVIFELELATAGEVPGPGSLTWSLVAGDTTLLTATTRLTVEP